MKKILYIILLSFLMFSCKTGDNIERLESENLDTKVIEVNDKSNLESGEFEEYKAEEKYNVLASEDIIKNNDIQLGINYCLKNLTQGDINELHIFFGKRTKDEWCKLEKLEGGLLGGASEEIPGGIYKMKGLVTLNLDEWGIDSISSQIGNLTNLRVLSLWINNIDSIPREIGKLQKLESLNLGGNDIKELPSEIWSLSSLKHLFLHSNNLEDISSEIQYLTNLKELYLNRNRIQYLPPEIGMLNNLEILDLWKNHLLEIPRELGGLRNLIFLELSDNQLNKIPSSLNKIKKMHYLNLSLNESIYPLDKQYGGLLSFEYEYWQINDEIMGDIRIKFNEYTKKVEIISLE